MCMPSKDQCKMIVLIDQLLSLISSPLITLTVLISRDSVSSTPSWPTSGKALWTMPLPWQGKLERFIGEESVAAGESCILSDDPTWIIDPIDGTTNFVHAFPFVAVSIGFSINKQVEFGVVYSCLEDKMFTARRGKGAFCNGEALQVSEQADIHQAIVATEFGSSRDPAAMDHIFRSLRNILCLPVHGVRGAGTAAINMCLVASGCVEAYYEIGIHVWDVAAGSLIVSEAGGVLMDVEGGDMDLMSRRIVAANNRTIAERIVKEIVSFTLQRDDAPLQS
uniref:Inositol-1-monophosphatase n=1 Tax=Oryzias latipes TaxID=8090 RepID=A0A3P9HMQ2_ORYLA